MDRTDYVNGDATFNELHDYTYDTLNRRDRDDLLGGVFWDYEYNERNEVISGSKRLTNGNQIPGWQWAYLYDSVGNRISAESGGDINGANRRITGYPAGSTNSLNQYTQIVNPDTFDVTGTAIDSPGVTVSVNQAPLTPGDRLGNFFRKELNGDNASGPAYVEVEIEGRALGLGVNGQDVVTRRTGRHYIPPANETLSYDLDGNLQEDGRWNYVWDGENRLKEMTTTAAAVTAGVPERKLEFLYDSQGRRIQKKVYAGDGDPGSPGPWTTPESDERFLYDGWNLVAILDGNNNLLKSFVWGLDLSGTAEGAGGVGGLLMVTDHTGPVVKSYFPVYDGNGNVLALINAENGDVEAQFEYSPFGEVARADGPAIGSSPFGFSTKYVDSETGLAYYGYRYYEPRLGRWLSRDPIEERGGLNLYRFVGNDSINQFDPLGLVTFRFEGKCTKAQQAQIRRATARAEQMVDSGVLSLKSVTPEKKGFFIFKSQNADTKRYERWFGAYDKTRLETARARFDEIKDLFGGTIIFDCCPDRCERGGDKPDAIAYVFPGRDVHIYLCPSFWKITDAYRARVVIHELAHEAPFHARDHIYHAPASKSLARSNPEKALENADNYSFHAAEWKPHCK